MKRGLAEKGYKNKLARTKFGPICFYILFRLNLKALAAQAHGRVGVGIEGAQAQGEIHLYRGDQVLLQRARTAPSSFSVTGLLT